MRRGLCCIQKQTELYVQNVSHVGLRPLPTLLTHLFGLTAGTGAAGGDSAPATAGAVLNCSHAPGLCRGGTGPNFTS